MASDILYGRTTLRPYFDMQKFEDRIYNRVSEREKRIKKRRKLKVLDRLLAIIIVLLLAAFLVVFAGILYRSVAIKSQDNNIKRLKVTLEKKIYENKSVVSSLKNDMRFDDIKMKAYMELNMITPTEKNIIHFNKSDNGFVRQYENSR